MTEHLMPLAEIEARLRGAITDWDGKQLPDDADPMPGLKVGTINETLQHLADLQNTRGIDDEFLVQIATWFTEHAYHHKASAEYNNRLAFVRNKRAQGDWSYSMDGEYQALNKARKEADDATAKLLTYMMGHANTLLGDMFDHVEPAGVVKLP